MRVVLMAYACLFVQCIQTADGLAFLHSVKPPILHRDLRSAHILLDSSAHVKVATNWLTNDRFCRPFLWELFAVSGLVAVAGKTIWGTYICLGLTWGRRGGGPVPFCSSTM